MTFLAGKQAIFYTRSTDELPFDHRCSPSFFGHGPRDQFAAGAAAKYKNIVFFLFTHANNLL
jgi:hypothetical protein